MVTTSDGIWSPDPGDNFDLTVDWAANASSVQAAIDRRSGHSGSTANRNSFGASGARNGVTWWDSSENVLYVWENSAWRRVGPSADTGWITLDVYRNSFSAVSSDPPRYRVRDGVVYLAGQVGRSNPTGSTQLEAVNVGQQRAPVGDIYTTTTWFGSNFDQPTRVRVAPDGWVWIGSTTARPASASPAYSIAGISWPIG